MLIIAVLIQSMLPLGLALWLAARRARSWTEWALVVLCACLGLALSVIAIPWLVVPSWLAWCFAALIGVAAVTGARRLRRAGPQRLRAGRPVWRLIVPGSMAALMLGGVLYVVSGWQLPSQGSVDLGFPLGPGHYLVVHGGSNTTINPHLQTLEPLPRYVPWRGQSHAVDLVALDHWGFRASGVQPAEPTAYRIYGRAVLAPCAGTVVVAVDGRADMPVPERDPDPTQLAGNHVTLFCSGIEVLLAHLQPGSLRVGPGDSVRPGQPLALVGNSGNTTEPHLHISAQRRQAGQPPQGGDPVPIVFDGRYPVRGRHWRVGEP